MSSNNNKLFLSLKSPKKIPGKLSNFFPRKTDHSAESFTPSGCVCADTESTDKGGRKNHRIDATEPLSNYPLSRVKATARSKFMAHGSHGL